MSQVAHSHIVPRGYLASWTNGDGMIAMKRRGVSEVYVSPRDAGVRKGFYREKGESGYVNVLDPQMSELERLAIPIIRSLEGSGPLSRAARATVAEFLGLQVVRGPAWRSRLDEFVETGLAVQASLDAGVAEEVAHRASEEMRVPERRNRLLSPHTAIAATMFVNMHWTLLVAAKPCLFTSDHPVVLVPLGANGRGKAEPLPSTGLVNTMEFRFAATPTTLLLGCWLDEVDGLEPGRLARHQAQSHNALVAEQAEHQWFRHPDGPAVPPRRGVWRSIAGERHRSYTVHAASRSLRRAGVRDEVEAVTAARMRSPRIKQISWIGPGAAPPPRAESGPQLSRRRQPLTSMTSNSGASSLSG